MSNGRSGDDWDIYQQAFREDAHQLLFWGYADSRNRIGPDDEEEAITAYIAEAIKLRINAPLTPEKFCRYAIHNAHFVSPAGQTGKRQLKLDLMLEHTGIKPHRHFVFEAKRLKTGSHSIGKYTGDEGLGCFVGGLYAATDPEAAMVGYMQNRDAPYWFSELERVFSEDETNGRRDLRIAERLRKNVVVPDLPNEWASTHTRTNGSPMHVFHIFVECS